MSVVINEFEIIAEPPQDRPKPATPGAAKSMEKPPVRAADIIKIVERNQQRLARLFAD